MILTFDKKDIRADVTDLVNNLFIQVQYTRTTALFSKEKIVVLMVIIQVHQCLI